MPRFLNTVESDRSLCNLDFGSFSAKNPISELDMPKFPSEFSKSIGLTL